MVLAITDDDQGVGLFVGFFKGFDGELNGSSEVRDAGTAVCTIGVGSAEGGMIPDLRTLDGKFRDIKGDTVYSKLNSSALEQLANAGAGSYVAASSGADHTIRRALASLERTQESGRVIDIPNETYQWFLCPAIVLLILSVLTAPTSSRLNSRR